MSGLWSELDELASEYLPDLDTDTLGQDIVMLGIAIERLEAERVRRVSVFDRRGGHADEGSLSTASWLVARSHLAPGAAKQRVDLGHRLENLPKIAEAFAAGSIGYGQVRVVCDATKDLDPEFVVDSQEPLLDESRRCEPRKLERRLTHWRHRGDAATEVERARKQHARRELKIAPKAGGMFGVQGDLDAEGGAIVLTALDALSAPDPSYGEARTPAQRRADALVELARRALDAGDLPDRGGERPHLAVTVPLDTLMGRPGAPGADLDWSGVLTGEAVRRISCDCKVHRVITDGASQPLDVGRATRVPSAALRRALVVRDRGCVFPGCGRPAAWCDVHHLVHWTKGGPTCRDNCVLLCSAHHRMVHEDGWDLRRGRDGRILVRPPPHVMRR
ncbi:MAG: DUF222 domain-containing protein [Acidimicrobiia bacterium]